MSLHKSDKKTKKRLMSKYKSTIITTSSSNNLLLSQIKDLKTTLDLNQNLLYNYLISREGDREAIKSLINKSKILWNKYDLLINNNINIEIKTEALKIKLPQIPSKINNQISNLSKINNTKQKELILKDNSIKKLKKDLEKVRKSQFFKTARMEIFVTNPSKKNLEFNGELISAKAMFTKISDMSSKAKKKSEKLEKEVKKLREEMNTFKNKAYTLYNNNKSKNNSDIVKSINNYEEFFLNNINCNTKIFENDKYDEFEEEENEESSESEENEENNTKVTKAKEKEYENLKENYEKLKIQINECQNNINKYKKNYKSFEEKIEKIKNDNYGEDIKKNKNDNE